MKSGDGERAPSAYLTGITFDATRELLRNRMNQRYRKAGADGRFIIGQQN